MSKVSGTWRRTPAALGSMLLVPLLVLAQGRQDVPWASATPAEREAFLLNAAIVSDSGATGGVRRASLDDGTRKHDAGVETSTGRDSSERDYRLNIAAYRLDQALELNLVAPTVERAVNGQPAAVMWWVDDVAMSEVGRRKQQIDPPDPARWDMDMQAVRVFDELVDNAYRDTSPAAYTSTVWDNLLITRNWRIWLIDHTRTFGTARQLDHPESLVRCDRTVLRKLKEIDKDALTRRVGALLSAAQLDALDTRRALIVTHFDEQIAGRGAGAVLYDRPPRP